MKISSVLRYGLGVLERSGIPRYTSKFSRKDYTTYQHLLVCVYKAYDKCSWRNTVDGLDDSDKIREAIGLTKIPHFTTPDKFLLRIPIWWFNYIFNLISKYALSQYHIAIDGTGFKLNNASSHYEITIRRKIRKKNYLKSIIGWDTRTHIIVRAKLVQGNRN